VGQKKIEGQGAEAQLRVDAEQVSKVKEALNTLRAVLKGEAGAH
jgi:hypothetical protein